MSVGMPAGETPGETWVGKNKKWLVLAALALVVVAVALAVVFWPSKKLVKADRLDSLLLNARQINAIMGSTEMGTLQADTAMGQGAGNLSNPECLAALTAAQAPTYAGSGYTAMRLVPAKEFGGAVQHYVAQAAVVFPDDDKARALVASVATQWQGCAGQNVTVTESANSVATWQVGTVAGEPPSVAVVETRQDAEWACQRVMRAVDNVVIDATACAAHIGDEGNEIADAIAANIAK